MKIAVKTPTNAVTAKATVGKGVVRPKFSKSPLPVDISTVMATAKPTIASLPSHTSKLLVLPPLVLCSHVMVNVVALHTGFLWLNDSLIKKGEPVAKMEPVPEKLEMGTRESLWVVFGEMIGETS